MQQLVQRVHGTPKSNNSTFTSAIGARQICFFAAFILPVFRFLETPSLLSAYTEGDLLLPAVLHFLIQSLPIGALLFITSKTERGLFSLLYEKLGKVGTRVVYAILAIYYLFSTILPILDLEKYVQAVFFDTAPSMFSLTPFFLLSAFISSRQLRSFGRIADLCLPIFLIGFFGVTFMSVGKADFEAMLPWFEFPFEKIALATKNTTAHFSDAILFFPLLGDYQYKKGDGKKILGSYWVGCGFCLFFFATFYGLFTSVASTHHYALSKIGQYFSALQTLGRIDLIFSYLLTIILFYNVTLPIQFCVLCITKTLGLKQRTPTSALLNFGLFLFAFFCNRHYDGFYALVSKTLWWIFPTFSVLLPLLALLLLLGKRRTNAKNRTLKENTYAY
ncbi:MAG: GerAB/ArcD/ProY family transporter [Clostridia bacterium]|nr:GerAB/ArcD/ProY family transporter [Clostridia bacterium]